MTAHDSAAARRSAQYGLIAVLGCFAFWGLSPIYYKAIGAVPALEVVAHRTLWTAALLGVFCALTGRARRVAAAVSTLRGFGYLAAASLLIAVNWLGFVYAVQSGRTAESSLGYYIYPVLAAFLGRVFLKEAMRPAQYLALSIAFGAVGFLVWRVGEPPWIALTLALSFSIYGLVRKLSPVGPIVGVFWEAALLAPFAAFYLWRADGGAFTAQGGETAWLLALSGLVTGAPLVLFAEGSRRLRLSTVGVLMYLNPTIQFFVSVLVFHEPLDQARLMAFAAIWIAVLIYCADALRADRASRIAAGRAAGSSVTTKA